MFWMPTIAPSFVIFSTRASIQVYKAVIVASCYDCLIFAHLNYIDMTTVGPSWVYPIDKPPELHCMVCPSCRCRSWCTSRYLDQALRVKEQELIGTTRASDPWIVYWPIQGRNVARVTPQDSMWPVLSLHVSHIDVYVVVVGANCQAIATLVVAHNFDPLLRVVHLASYCVQLNHRAILIVDFVNITNRDAAVIVSHGKML